MLGDVRRVLAGRKPKLGDAQRPNPSGPYSAPTGPRSTRQVPASNSRIDLHTGGSTSTGTSRSDRPLRRSECGANVALILAIAALVGVATFVMVRERVGGGALARASSNANEALNLESGTRRHHAARAERQRSVSDRTSGASRIVSAPCVIASSKCSAATLTLGKP